MKHVAMLRGAIQRYAWGSTTAIPEFLGEAPDGGPQAELWLGAHPNAPSSVNVDGRWVPITQLLEKSPDDILGSASVNADNQFPFLFKVLAAAKPLSIQAHPDARQAMEGFSRENALNIPLDAPQRNYKDGNHKPECICALTPFWALNGFRKIREILTMVSELCPVTLSGDIALLKSNQNSQGLKCFFQSLMEKKKNEVRLIVEETVRSAKQFEKQDSSASWILKLHEAYQRDIGVLAPAFLNLVCLNPGEAMYLSAGRLHAYLEGVGIEIMANSDNVLRGGLTQKHIDVPELLKVLQFSETSVDILKPVSTVPGEMVYETPAEEFVLSELTVKRHQQYESPTHRGVEILLCTQGDADIYEADSQIQVHINRGMSLLIPASVLRYDISGDAVFYRASSVISGK